LSRNCQALAFKLSWSTRYIPRMVQERANHFTEATPAPEIEALLSVGGSASIVDGLLAIPRPRDAGAPNEWERAITDRLQTRVSRMMRAQIERPRKGI
jgi:hypothetical protein